VPASRYRVVFFGTPSFAVPSLRALLAGPDEVVGVVCQPDRPAGRGQHVQPPPVKALAQVRGLPVLQPTKLRGAEFATALRGCSPDLVVVAAYGRILPSAILELPRLGCINVHASLLPKYRGAAPIQWAILRGETSTGVTIMRMNERMDEGDILLQREIPILADETYGELQGRLADLGAETLMEALADLEAGKSAARAQDHAAATLAPMIDKADGAIDWTLSSDEIARRVRAFNPWPSAFTRLKGKLLKLHRARALAETTAAPPGTVLSTGAEIRVATAEGVLAIDELQLEGRRRMLAREFARGGALSAGVRLGDDRSG
jgi:methionyl-tRNA formyltransferase